MVELVDLMVISVIDGNYGCVLVVVVCVIGCGCVIVLYVNVDVECECVILVYGVWIVCIVGNYDELVVCVV